MKFSHSLQFNSVPEWGEYYISYSSLKRIIHQVERLSFEVAQQENHLSTEDLSTSNAASPKSPKREGRTKSQLTTGSTSTATDDKESNGDEKMSAKPDDEHDERAPLLFKKETYGNTAICLMQTKNAFVTSLDRELAKIVNFYRKKEAELIEQMEKIIPSGNSLSPKNVLIDINELEGTTRNVENQTEQKEEAKNDEEYIEDDIYSSISSNNLLETHHKRKRTGGLGGEIHHVAGGNGGKNSLPSPFNVPTFRFLTKPSKGTYGSVKAIEEEEKYRNSLIMLYINFHNLKDYLELNYSGFMKILKKYDKCTNSELRSSYMRIVDASLSNFRNSQIIPNAIHRIEVAFNDRFCGGKHSTNDDGNDSNNQLAEAQAELRQYLKDHIVFERSTVWRELLELEKKTQPSYIDDTGSGISTVEVVLGSGGSGGMASPGGNGGDSGHNPLKVHHHKVQQLFNKYKNRLLTILIALLVFSLLVSGAIPSVFSDPAQNSCFAILIFASILWSSEAIPLYVTSILVPLLVIVFQGINDKQNHNTRLGVEATGKHVFSVMFSQTIMLLMGGFSIAAALSKYNIAKSMAIEVLSRTGGKPRNVLLANMMVATFASMWISNVAAPVLCFSIIQPILRTLPSGHPFAKCLIMGIALASNVGGMSTPISSPQNVIAVQEMNNGSASWLAWFSVSIPVCLTCNILIWLFMLMVYQPGKSLLEVMPIRKTKEPLNQSQWMVLFITLVTITLWCLDSITVKVFGGMGVVAILPIVAFFGSGLLGKEDFNSFPWTVVFLAMGGLVLGDAVATSGMLAVVGNAIRERVIGGWAFYPIVLVLCLLVLCIATFISHTVGAMVLLPIVRVLGESCNHPQALVMLAALCCSAAMGLPISGFPNMAAMGMEDSVTGRPHLEIRDFIRLGIPSSLLSLLVICTLGYGIMIGLLGY